MLQCGQDSILNHALHRFSAHNTYNYGHIASFTCFHLATVSQRDHHGSVLNNIKIILLYKL